MPGLILSAPASRSGKTTITLGLLRALSRRGLAVRGAKSGPDYIDPRYHEAACGRSCLNFDAWAMPASYIREAAAGSDLLLVEGAMGLFDGAPPDGAGSVADLARILKLPVVLVVDASSMAQSIAPLVVGYAAHDEQVSVAGVILNRVGSPRHERTLRQALEAVSIPVFGAVRRSEGLSMPSRHLGLVQAEEHPDLQGFLDRAADHVAGQVDMDALLRVAGPLPIHRPSAPIPPTRRHIAIARDAAFGFCYPHMLRDWVRRGASLSFFSPLANDPVPPCDMVFLPGGYPELFAAQLASNLLFMNSLKKSSQHAAIYGECGGYMLLGKSLIDAEGVSHKMAGLLELETSFAQRKLHLGYRNLKAERGPVRGEFAGHEFHYATTLRAEGTPLFEATDAEGARLPPMGLIKGRVSGSFAHIISPSLP